MSAKKQNANSKVSVRNWSLDKFTASVKRNCARRKISVKGRMTFIKSAYDEGLSVYSTVDTVANG